MPLRIFGPELAIRQPLRRTTIDISQTLDTTMKLGPFGIGRQNAGSSDTASENVHLRLQVNGVHFGNDVGLAGAGLFTLLLKSSPVVGGPNFIALQRLFTLLLQPSPVLGCRNDVALQSAST